MERDREYTRFMAQPVHRYAILPLTTSDIERASTLTQRHPLKAYDAVQLAVAVRYHQMLAVHPLTFICGDQTLINAAQAEGLAPANPFAHVVPEERETSARAIFLISSASMLAYLLCVGTGHDIVRFHQKSQ